MDSSILTTRSTHARRLTLVVGLAVAAFLVGVVPSTSAAESFRGKVTSAAAARKAAKQDPRRERWARPPGAPSTAATWCPTRPATSARRRGRPAAR